jgi:hypothetical protein
MGFYKKARSFVKQYMGIQAGRWGKDKGAGYGFGDLSLDLPSVNSLYNFIHIFICFILFNELVKGPRIQVHCAERKAHSAWSREQRGKRKEEREKG